MDGQLFRCRLHAFPILKLKIEWSKVSEAILVLYLVIELRMRRSAYLADESGMLIPGFFRYLPRTGNCRFLTVFDTADDEAGPIIGFPAEAEVLVLAPMLHN